MSEQTCPPLPSGSVDFSVLQKAAKSDRDLDAALKSATTSTFSTGAGGDQRTVTVPTPDYQFEAKDGGWHVITGPGLDEPFKTQDRAAAGRKWQSLTGEPLPTGIADTDA